MARRPRDPGTGQLDLFLTETEPAPAKTPPPRLVLDPPSPTSPPPPPADPEPPTPTEPDMTPEQPPIPPTDPIADLPPPPDDPPEVAADIRAMFLEEEERQRAEETITIREGKPPLVTGIYRKPRAAVQKPLVMPLADPLRPSAPAAAPAPARPAPQPERPIPPPRSPAPRPVPPPSPRPAAPAAPSRDRFAPLRNFFAGAPLGRKGLLALLGAILLVALLAWWSGAPKKPAPQEPTLASTDLPSTIPPASPELPPPADDGGATPTLPPPSSLPATPTPPATATATATPTAPAGAPATGLRIPGATVTLTGDGAWQVRYDAAVFVSADRISVEGMKALKATAAALLKLSDGATVTIQGHTDDIPPPPDATGPFRTNADLAAARADVVREHLNVFCKRQSRYLFETSTTAPAPYPNDTDAHRRLNRTVTLRIVPTNRTAD